MRRLLAALAMIAAGATATGAGQFSLDLDAIELRPSDPRTEARLASWNSPLGRLAYQMAGEQAALGRGGLVGTPPGIVAGVKLQRGIGLQLVTSTVEAGISRYEQTVKVIRWPWSDADEAPILPLDEQLAMLLGRRLERHK